MLKIDLKIINPGMFILQTRNTYRTHSTTRYTCKVLYINVYKLYFVTSVHEIGRTVKMPNMYNITLKHLSRIIIR